MFFTTDNSQIEDILQSLTNIRTFLVSNYPDRNLYTVVDHIKKLEKAVSEELYSGASMVLTAQDPAAILAIKSLDSYYTTRDLYIKSLQDSSNLCALIKETLASDSLSASSNLMSSLETSLYATYNEIDSILELLNNLLTFREGGGGKSILTSNVFQLLFCTSRNSNILILT